jgi:hypothetical protein
MKQVAGRIHRSEPQAEFRKLALEPITLAACADGRKVEVRPRPWSPGSDAELDVADAALGAPGEELPPVEFRQRIRINANSHVIALRNAEVRSSISRRLQPATVSAGGFSHSTCSPASRAATGRSA